jgi:hypothetical protein
VAVADFLFLRRKPGLVLSTQIAVRSLKPTQARAHRLDLLRARSAGNGRTMNISESEMLGLLWREAIGITTDLDWCRFHAQFGWDVSLAALKITQQRLDEKPTMTAKDLSKLMRSTAVNIRNEARFSRRMAARY